MDSKELTQAWNTICLKVQSYSYVDSSQVEAFFSRLKPQAMSSGFLMLTADNEFIKNWIGTHYLPAIKDALNDIYGIPYTVLVEVDPAQAVNQTVQTQTPSTTPNQTQTTTNNGGQGLIQSQTSDKEIDEELNTEEGSPGEISRERLLSFSPTSSLTFENFVIGDSNRMAYSMAAAVADIPGKDLHRNPLFIYGKSGLGKTHLLRAIQNYIQSNLPELSVVYVDSSELVSDYTEASVAHDKEKSSYKNFKKRYEEANVLLIDDVQSLQGKKQTLEMVFQIFNNLISKGNQIVLSADRAPKNIDIDERYQSRFNSGATIDIQPPEVETKLGIIKTFIDEYRETEGNPDFSISEDIQMYIAENSGSNVRELKSAVTKVIGQIAYFNVPDISLGEVKRLLENHFSSGSINRITVADIQKAVENFYKISHADLVGRSRVREISHPRQVAMYLCRQLTDLPQNDIGKKFNRNHATVIHSINNIDVKVKENRELSEEIELLIKTIREG